MFARVLVCAAAAVVLQVQTPVPATAPTGLVVGQVVDATTGQPIPEAEVTIRSTSTVSPTSQVPAINTRVIADGSGRYYFAPLPAGGYTIRASKPGYLDGTLGARRPPSVSNRAPGLAPYELGEGQRVTDATIRLWKQASISGVVVDDAGEPMVRVQVITLSRTFVSGRPRFVRAGSSMTDDRGAFRVSALVPGQFIVAVPSTQTSFPMTVIDAYARTGGGARSPLQDEMSTASPEISVLGSNRNQQVGAHVLMTLSYQPTPPPPNPDDIPAVFRTTYFPSATSATDAQVITIAAGEERTSTNLQLRSVRSARVSGSVAGPAGPLALTALRLVPANFGDAFPDREFEVATTITDPSGAFTFLAVPPGAYTLKLVSPRNRAPANASTPAAPLVWASQAVTVGDTDVTQLAVIARPAVKVAGSFIVAPASATPRSGVNPGVQENVTFTPATEQVAPYRAMSTANRTFSTEVPGGRYSMTFEEPPGWFVVSAAVNGRDVRDGMFDLTDDATVVLTYSDNPTRLAGTIRTAQGVSDPTATAMVFPTDRTRWSGYSAAPARLASARAATSGAYTISNVPAGEYYVVAIADEDAVDWTNPVTLERLARAATTITLRDGEKRTLDLRTVVVK